MSADTIPADKRLRRLILLLVSGFALALLLLAPALTAFLEEVKRIGNENPALVFDRFSGLLKWLLGLTGLLISTASVYLIIVASRILKADCYPPPGMRVIRATRLRTGRQAKIRAYILIVNAVILILLVSLLFFLIVTMVDKLRVSTFS